nr:hypothetical protein [Chlamydiota bacterium]
MSCVGVICCITLQELGLPQVRLLF